MSQLRKLFILLLLLIPTSAFAVTAGVEDAKSVARLYSAAFNRNPDISGLNFWVYSYEAGRSLLGIAGDFYKSPEFTSRYGTLSDLQYVELLYRNVLGRPGEKAGVDFWTDHLVNGVSRAKILTEFSDSPENVAKTAEIFANMHIMNCQWLFGSAQPVNDNTGCLVGPAVSGLAYETPTHQGVTGPRGDFHYEKGETVRFMLGDTLLGQVLAQAQMTPFDLAGAAVVTGLNIEWALDRSRYGGQVGPATPSGSIYIDEQITPEYGPFFPLVNMVVFLQSLDADADPTNGIEIRSEVAALFNGVNLNLNQEWQTFLNEPALRHAIWRANNEHRFSKAHRIVNPAPALKNLYQSLKVNARTAAVSQEWYWDMYSADANSSVQYQYDVDGNRTRVKTLRADGTVDEVLTRRYDAEGNVIRQSIDSNGDGIRDERDEVVVRKYDQNGNPPQIELDQNADGVTDYVEYWLYDSVGNATLVKEGRREFTLGTFEGRSITREIYTGGNLTRIEFDGDDDGIIDSTDTFEYDSQGHLARFEGELPSGPRGVRVWNYDADGNLTKYVESFDSGVAATLTQNWRYDDNGHITYYDQDTTGDGSPEVVYRYLYDGERKLSQVEHWESWGSTIETDTYLLSYDGRGNLTRLDRNMESYQYFYAANEKLIRVETTSKFRPGIVQTTSYEYDSNGNLILFRVGDLSGGELSTWQYSPDGNNIRYEFRSDRNNPSPELVREYETKGWGHLFFDSAVFN